MSEFVALGTSGGSRSSVSSYYGLVTSIDNATTSPLMRLNVELIEAAWFEAVIAEDGLADGVRAIRDAFEGRDFLVDVYDVSPPNGLRTHLDYMARILAGSDPAPVSLAQIGIDPLAQTLVESEWYRFDLDPDTPLPTPREVREPGEVIFCELGFSVEQDGEIVLRRLAGAEPVGGLRNLLHFLHFAHVDEQAAQGGAEEHGKGGGGREPDARALRGAFAPMQRRGTAQRHMRAQYAVASYGGGSGSVELDSPGSSFDDSGFHADPGPDWPQGGVGSAGYSGSRLSRASGGGAGSPYVGVLNVGQGQCNVIVEAGGTAIAFVDFGQPLKSNAPTAPSPLPSPCVCSDPYVVLSHWDYDHYAMARQQQCAYQLRWIVPQQPMGPVAARDLYARVLWDGSGTSGGHGNGAVYAWTSARPNDEHLVLSCGYAERAKRVPISNRNESGISVLACLDGAPTSLASAAPCAARRGRTILSPPTSFPATPTSVPTGAGAAPSSSGASPPAAAARWVLLPGDVSFDHVPSLTTSPPELVAIVAPHHGSDARLTHSVRFLPHPTSGAPGHVVYSYGISPTRMHCYPNKKGEGHPRSPATTAYAARGWTQRRNTSPLAPYSTQPDPSPCGDIALTWNAATGAPLTTRPTWSCGTCSTSTTFVV